MVKKMSKSKIIEAGITFIKTIVNRNKGIAEIEDKEQLKKAIKIEIEKLRIALLQLTEEEYKLIKALFFENKTLREYAAIVGKHYTTIQDKRDRILEKLKKFIKI